MREIYAYLFTAWEHWLPPFFFMADLYLHLEHCQRRHRIHFKSSLKRVPGAQPLYKQVVKILWTYVGPFVIIGIWFIAGFTPKEVYHSIIFYSSHSLPLHTHLDCSRYHVEKTPYKIAIPVAVVVQIICASVYLHFITVSKKEEKVVN